MNTWKFMRGEFDLNVLRAFEQEYGISFPEPYIDLVSEFNGSCPEKESFDLTDKKQMVFNTLLTWDVSRKSNVKDVSSWFCRETNCLNTIPIANDPFGNLICLSFIEKKAPVVVVWFHETGVVKTSKKTFSNFIEALY